MKVKIPRLDLSNRVSYSGQVTPEHEDGKPSLYDHSPLPRVTWASFSMGVLVSMGGCIFGYDTGQISGFLAMPDFLERFGQFRESTGEYYFSDVRSGLIVGMLSIGTLIGALVAAPIADRIGRRPSISFWCVIFCIGLIVQMTSVDKWYQVMMGRWVAGLGVGALSLLVPMYQAETAPPHIRGALISTYQLLVTLGIFLAACINYGCYEHQRDNATSWRLPIGIGFVWAFILGIGIMFFPETPRYVYRKGDHEGAKKTMMKVYGTSSENHYSIHHELAEIDAKLRAESATTGSVRDFFQMLSAPKMAYRIALGMLLQMFQQLTGANYFFYYGTVIFESTGIDNSFVTQMILNGINFGTTFYGLYIVEHYGRRKSLIVGSTAMFVCFLIFASIGHFSLNRDEPTKTERTGIAMICFAAFFIFSFATTWGPMIWTIIGELYPSRYRAKGMALATASNWLWNFLLSFFTPFITSAIDFQFGYVFAGCNVLGGLLVYFFAIEGQGRTLEELDTMYLEGVAPWKSSKWVAPHPEEMSRIRANAGTASSIEAGNFDATATHTGTAGTATAAAATAGSEATDQEKRAEHRE
ncbi:putative siderophore iron transporter mirc [Phaeomoniella chlamydospora]|uniref:Putative siderophore iron transporter mirc n=1 Tax=Phaeomoniella chlamydospora TaxID=158046 RepID=A0A0G2EBQ2_PHACM|nr:putative siderophore iron transporter mirc [Phaeomoniella chlamydospora]